MKKLSTLLVLLLGLCLISGFAINEKNINKNDGKPVLVQDEIIVKYASDVTDVTKKNIKARFDLTKKADSHKKGAFTVYKHKNPTAVLNKLKNEPGVISVEQNAYAYAQMIPNDTFYNGFQWHMTRIGMEDAWDLNTGSGVVVAVVDSGVMQSLEDLANTTFMAGYDFINNDNDPTDDEGHGSHVTGTIAQSTNNNLGCVGIAYNCTIMPVKVLDNTGSGSYTAITNGIYYAVDNGADIINMSLGGPSSLTILEDAINYAWNNGVVVVCAAGNDGVSSAFYPAAYTNSISVSATNYLDQLADYSNYGSTIDICAPGGDTNDYNGDTYIDGVLQNTFSGTDQGYYFFYGTSMASPHVAGVAALVKAANPALSNADVRNILENTAEDMGTAGWDQYFGIGMVDAYAAVQAAGTGNQLPVANFSSATNLLTATFTDLSSDSDGSIVSWAWNFGDAATSTAQNPVHTYVANGTYTVSLTVTDNDGGVKTTNKDVTVSDGTVVEMFVNDITVSVVANRRKFDVAGVVTIKDSNGNFVSGATVSITWSGSTTGSYSGVTGATGQVTFSKLRQKYSGPFTLTVNNVTHASLSYNSSLNLETSDSGSY